jgi:carboxymethylenebutenolidase
VKLRYLVACVVLLPVLGIGQSAPSLSPDTVVVPSGTLRLKGLLWMPPGREAYPAVLFVHGSGSADAAHTGELAITEAAATLAPVFVKHGYAFLYLFRRGQGLSADQGPFMQDILRREKAAKGDEARKRLQLVLKDHLDDVMAGLSYLKMRPGIDARRIAVVGHSFGGQLTLLAAQYDRSVRAAVTFGAAAASWQDSPEVRDLLLNAVRKANVPIMLIHAANDYSTAPGKALDSELTRLSKEHVLRIYPPFGRTPDDGHMFIYTDIAEWEPDVFRFLDQYVSHRPGPSEGRNGQRSPFTSSNRPRVIRGYPVFGNRKCPKASLTGGTQFVTVNQSFTITFWPS